jgi:hypothetical protein
VPDGREPDEPSVPAQRTARDPTNWPLELGETLIVYHPHAKLTPQVVPTKKLAALSRNSGDLEDLFPSNCDSRPPYFPFKTLADFEQTELFVRRDHTDGEINHQLDLWRRHAPCTGVTLSNAREMHQFLETAGVEEDLSQVCCLRFT